MAKQYRDQDVLSAARERVGKVFDAFEHICVSFSGGKDSTVLLHLVEAEARRRDRTVDVLFIDWEAQYQATIDHVTEVLQSPTLNPLWVCLPLSTPNESSFYEPMWTAWDVAEQHRWVRPIPTERGVISSYDYFPFYRYGMTFEEFVPAFNAWYTQQHGPSAFCIGIRADESLNRFRAVSSTRKGRKHYHGWQWTSPAEQRMQGWNAYPIYDWGVEDIWGYIALTKAHYNRIYDAMYYAGMSLHTMRICEPYSKEARSNLDKYHVLEPATWEKIVARTGGVNAGALYGGEGFYGYREITKPEGMTWKEYAQFLLDSMPPVLREHYQQKIDVFVGWFRKNLQWEDLKDETDLTKEMNGSGGSWRMVARTLLRNDYFCLGLRFSATQQELEKINALREKYKEL